MIKRKIKMIVELWRGNDLWSCAIDVLRLVVAAFSSCIHRVVLRNNSLMQRGRLGFTFLRCNVLKSVAQWRFLFGYRSL